MTLALHPEVAASGHAIEFRRDVLLGLAATPRAVPGKHLWDDEGSRLFDAITTSPGYYPTGAEMALLRVAAPDIAAMVGPAATIVEFGSGACHKVDLLLSALDAPQRYVAIDIAQGFLGAATAGLRARHPRLDIRAVCADYSRDLPPLPLPSDGPVLGFFPGTSIGNMSPASATKLLTRIRRALGPSRLLVGADPTVDATRLQAAYGSRPMADFHRNLLHRMRRELDASLWPEDFVHEARVTGESAPGAAKGAANVTAHLVARRETTITIGATAFRVRPGESLRTDISCKYPADAFAALAAASGWRLLRAWRDPEDRFVLYGLETS